MFRHYEQAHLQAGMSVHAIGISVRQGTGKGKMPFAGLLAAQDGANKKERKAGKGFECTGY
jgi:hypothetical protein